MVDQAQQDVLNVHVDPGRDRPGHRQGPPHSSSPDLIGKIEEFLDAHNEQPKPFVWTATTESILIGSDGWVRSSAWT